MAKIESRIRSVKITPQAAKTSERAPQNVNVLAGSRQSTGGQYPIMFAAKSASSQDDLSFEFPFPPEQVGYRDVGLEMSQIERAGKTPLIAVSRFKLKQVDLQFMVAIPFDGLRIDIEEDVQTLERIAKSGRPVWFYNFDRFLSDTFSNTLTQSSFFWSITDMSFNSVRRNAAQRIVQAEVSLSIIENRNPAITVIELPKINYTDNPARQNPRNPNPSQTREQNFIEWTDVDKLNRV